jgi:site-specific DNA recombinase
VATITTIDPSKKDDKKKLKVAAYCRVSTGTAEQEESLTAQREHYEDYIKSNPDWQFAGLYYDEAVSGTSTERREALAKMLEDARQGKIDFILTKSISRFSRNKIDCLNMTRELSACGVGIYFEKENINTQTMGSEFLLAVMSSLAESESRSISTNEKWGIQVRMKNGTYKQSSPPYGYKADNGKLVIDKEEAEVVKMIFRMALDGMGSYKIAKRLNELGIETPRNGKLWRSSNVRGMLHNERYIGDTLYMKTFTDEEYNHHNNHGEVDQYYLKNTHEPIITREDFEKVQLLIGQRKKERKIQDGTGVYHSGHLFTGKIVCLHCGAHLKHVVRNGRNSGLYDAWACPTHIRDKDKCPLKVIEDSKIRAAFITMMNKLIFARRQVLEPYIKNLESLDTETADKEIAEIDEKYSTLLKQQTAIMQLAADGVLDASTCQKELADLNDKKNELGSKKTTLTMAISNNYKYTTEAGRLLRYLRDHNITKEMDEDAFLEFVDEIAVYSRNMIGFRLSCGLELKEELK